jgi:hypothetical protein
MMRREWTGFVSLRIGALVGSSELAINLGVSYSAENLLARWPTISFWSRTNFRKVYYLVNWYCASFN